MFGYIIFAIQCLVMKCCCLDNLLNFTDTIVGYKSVQIQTMSCYSSLGGVNVKTSLVMMLLQWLLFKTSDGSSCNGMSSVVCFTVTAFLVFCISN